MKEQIIVDAFQVIDIVRTKLNERIVKKTLWGKNELELEIERAINDAIMSTVEFSIQMDNMPT